MLNRFKSILSFTSVNLLIEVNLFALQEDVGIETDEEYGAVIPNL